MLNNPVNYFDPLGLSRNKIAKLIGLFQLPKDPSGLPKGWKPAPYYKYPHGQGFKDPSGRLLEWHPARPGMPGERGIDHWHDRTNFPKDHLRPGTEIPDPAPSIIPWWMKLRYWPGPFPVIILPEGWEQIIDPYHAT